MKRARRKANPVKNPEALQPGQHLVLQVGDQVQTPYGVGKVKSIALQIGVYPGPEEKDKERVELDPPRIVVTIDETGQDVVVCGCEVGLPNKQYEKILQEEYKRLWPPVDQPVPEVDEDNLSVAQLKQLHKQVVAKVVVAVKQKQLTTEGANKKLAQLKKVKTKGQLKKFLNPRRKLPTP